MPVIQRQEITQLTNRLIEKGLVVYHSCQLVDFKSYINLGGIPSRNLLNQRGQNYTAFETDENDEDNDVWDKVFFNLTDYGNYFAIYKMDNPNTASIPNIYGPISIQILPQSIEIADDMCLSLISAGREGFNREANGIAANQIDDIFVCIDCEKPYEERYITRTNELRERFNIDEPGALNPEINLTTENELISFENNVVAITVDSLNVNERTLQQSVQDVVNESDYQIPILNRRYHYYEGESRKLIKQTIINEIHNGRSTVAQITEALQANDYSREWIMRIHNGGLEYNLRRYLNYLEEGTVAELNREHDR